MADDTLQNVTAEGLSARQQRAAVLVSEDTKTDDEIAAEVGVTRMTLHRWKQFPPFQDAVKAVDAAILAKALRLPIARKHRRMSVLNDMHDKALDVVAARAIAHEEGPGGSTGLIVMQLKQVKHITVSEDGEVRSWTEEQREYVVDTGLMREIRAIQEQAAKEAGQWTEKIEEVGSGVRREYVIVRDDKAEGQG